MWNKKLSTGSRLQGWKILILYLISLTFQMAWGRGQRSTRIPRSDFFSVISQVKCQHFLILPAVHIISVWYYMYLTPRDLWLTNHWEKLYFELCVIANNKMTSDEKSTADLEPMPPWSSVRCYYQLNYWHSSLGVKKIIFLNSVSPVRIDIILLLDITLSSSLKWEKYG